jgi:hypothetical protein
MRVGWKVKIERFFPAVGAVQGSDCDCLAQRHADIVARFACEKKTREGTALPALFKRGQRSVIFVGRA